MTFELGLRHEREPATGSAETSVCKGPRAGKVLASGVSKGRRVW